jgi:glucan biosynthesis protein C
MPAPARRYDLDALRVGAFLLLLLYHLGMFYVSWDWHVKSSNILPGLEPWMGVLNPWRLSLLFVISGAATRFMADKTPSATLAGQRSQRLLIPLALGMILVVAPQSWAEVVEKNAYAGSFLDFWPRYLSFDTSFGIILPTYNHLWFVAYLWVYTMLAIALRPFWPAMERIAAWLLKGPMLLVLPALLFGLYRAAAWRAWGETHNVFADGYGHLQYGSAFLLGFVMARTDATWDFLERRRLAILAAAGGALAIGLFTRRYEYVGDGGSLAVAAAFVREAYAWTVICALFGYARRYIRSGSPLLTTLTEAVFPFYIIHQTAIVLAGHFLKPLGMPALAEAGTILAIEIAACLATYGLALAVPILRLPLGLRPAPRRLKPAAVATE